MNSIYKNITVLALSFMAMLGLRAQEKVTKVSQHFDVDKNVTIDLRTSHCNIIFDTWNKDEVSIEAFVESDKLTKNELEQIAKGWGIDVDGSTNKITIKTGSGGTSYSYKYSGNAPYRDEVRLALDNLKHTLADLPQMDFDFNFEDMHVIEVPEAPEMPEFPELPELPEGANAVAFDYETYKKDGDKYLEEWSKKFESKYGKDYAKKMEAWGEKFGKVWGEKYAKDMEKWGEKFGEEWAEQFADRMEAWGERYGAQMERQAERIEREAERIAEQYERRAEQEERQKEAVKRQKEALKRAKEAKKRGVEASKRAKERAKVVIERVRPIEVIRERSKHSHLKKTIIIKMPKKAKIKADVRHGELEFAAIIDNVEANLSHTVFKAAGINGSNTSINAAYAPVYVGNWNLGELNLHHVKQAELEAVQHLVLNSNSSNVKINKVERSAIVDGNIGDISILSVGDAFTNLNFILQNNNAYVVLPNVAYNLNYKGKQAQVAHPKNTNGSACSSFSVSHPESNKTVTVNAKYSKVTIK